tara:strand:+ start:120 stop:1469 length:1350 start_codon:yes stop_codon:yes gene_type:complete
MATKIVTKNSSTASAVPTASDLVQGELAVNVSDKRLFTEDNGGSIVELGTNPSTIDINAGTVDGAVIGGTTPAAITGTTVTSTGNIVVTGTVDGRDVATDGTKLDGIEASADVTDTTNVTAAGALMDSEVTNLAQVKAFDSADYATAAQGTLAANALPKAGGAMTGAITTNSTFDGRDVATDGTKLDGIEASADVTDTTNVVASLTAGSNITIAADGTIASTASGGGETLAQTLALGAVTGGTDISVSSGDNIVMAASSTVDGRDVSVDGTKLDGIEASADVTDATNVTAAGALMDSEVTNLAQVKAFDSSDYATATQGTTADAALPKAGGTVTGTVVFGAAITEDAVTLTGTSTTIDLATATNFLHDLTGATTYTFSNPSSTGNATAFTLKIIQDSTARAITWPSSVDWAGGTAPTLTATNNGVDVFVFYTIDGGTTYYGFTAGQAMA